MVFSGFGVSDLVFFVCPRNDKERKFADSWGGLLDDGIVWSV